MESGKLVVVVEDESDLSNVLCFHLEREGYRCRRAADGEAALAEIRRSKPDLVVLDRMLPRLSGDEVARRLKRDSATAGVPILMLTAKAEEADELVGFALGADDYVSKPYSISVVLARIDAILRRKQPSENGKPMLSKGPIVLDRARHEVTVDGNAVTLTPTEFRLLAALMTADGRVLDRGQLIDVVLGENVAVTDRTIDVHVGGLRRKLGDAAGHIQTIRGVGYTFRSSVDAPSQGSSAP